MGLSTETSIRGADGGGGGNGTEFNGWAPLVEHTPSLHVNYPAVETLDRVRDQKNAKGQREKKSFPEFLFWVVGEQVH